MNTQLRDSFEEFVDVMLTGLKGSETRAIEVVREYPIEVLDLVKAAERAGGLSRDVILQFAPKAFRGNHPTATLASFLAFWQLVQFCNQRYGWCKDQSTSSRIVVPKGPDNGGEGAGKDRPKRGIAARMAEALGIPNESAKILAKLEEFRGDDRNWEGARVKLAKQFQFDIELPSLNAFASLLRREVKKANKKE